MAGPPDDLGSFCAREYPRLVGMLDLYMGDLHVAEELAQETLLRVSLRWDDVRGLESPGGWAHRVALNLAKSRFRRWGAERRARARLEGRARPVHEDADVADAHAVREAIAGLPARQREALVLRYYAGWTAAEVGEQIGASPQAVRALTKRAVAGLRERLGSAVLEEEEASDVS